MRKFYYSYSVVYGWAVYDRLTNTPAYEAVTAVYPHGASPIMLTESKAAILCSRLNAASRNGTI